MHFPQQISFKVNVFLAPKHSNRKLVFFIKIDVPLGWDRKTSIRRVACDKYKWYKKKLWGNDKNEKKFYTTNNQMIMTLRDDEKYRQTNTHTQRAKCPIAIGENCAWCCYYGYATTEFDAPKSNRLFSHLLFAGHCRVPCRVLYGVFRFGFESMSVYVCMVCLCLSCYATVYSLVIRDNTQSHIMRAERACVCVCERGICVWVCGWVWYKVTVVEMINAHKCTGRVERFDGENLFGRAGVLRELTTELATQTTT